MDTSKIKELTKQVTKTITKLNSKYEVLRESIERGIDRGEILALSYTVKHVCLLDRGKYLKFIPDRIDTPLGSIDIIASFEELNKVLENTDKDATAKAVEEIQFYIASNRLDFYIKTSMLDDYENKLEQKASEVKRLNELMNAELSKKNEEILSAIKGQEQNSLKELESKLNSILDSSDIMTPEASSLMDRVRGKLQELDNVLDKHSEAINVSKEFSSKMLDAENKIKEIDNEVEKFWNTNRDLYLEYEGIESRKADIENIRFRLESLLDPAIAKNLLLTFSQRKRVLERSKTIWLVLVISIGLGFSFYFFYSLDEILKMADNTGFISFSLKLLPLGFLYGFFLRQYNRERKLEEQYAFKESIATSITAYASHLGRNESKDELITQTLDRLYSNPVDYINSQKSRNKKGYELSFDELAKIKTLIEPSESNLLKKVLEEFMTSKKEEK